MEKHIERISLPEPVKPLPAPSLTTTALADMIQQLNEMMERDLVTQVFGSEAPVRANPYAGAMLSASGGGNSLGGGQSITVEPDGGVTILLGGVDDLPGGMK